VHIFALNLWQKQKIMQTTAEEVQSLMNHYGAMRVPFLFGVDYELQKGFVITEPLQSSELLWEINGIGNAGKTDSLTDEISLEIVKADTEESYRSKFDCIRSGLLHGDSFLANLTTATRVATGLSFEKIFLHSIANYKLLIPNEFVCFSPESFVKIKDDLISTYPMKGTISADLPDAEQLLMDSEKELYEHYTIVDLLRNDLSMVAENVRVKRFRYAEKIHTTHGDIYQTSSEIVGKLPENRYEHLGDILFKLLPAGSISGAPKAATIDLIHKAEKSNRGWYTGVFGYFDGNNLDSGVMIRCLSRKQDGIYFHSGGGITINSSCEDEYKEVLQKIYLSIPREK
jgi:para-aminobenzoate synthetase component 1